MNFSSIRLRNQQKLLENILCDEKEMETKRERQEKSIHCHAAADDINIRVKAENPLNVMPFPCIHK